MFISTGWLAFTGNSFKRVAFGVDLGLCCDVPFLRLLKSFLDACLGKNGVLAARVSSEKPDIYPDCESVGFEIFRSR